MENVKGFERDGKILFRGGKKMMKDNGKDVFIITNKYLAYGINYLTGERFYLYTNKEGRVVYSFKNTINFKEAYEKIKMLKKELNN